MQPDNSNFLGIVNPDRRGALAQIEIEGPDGKRKPVNFDILELNKSIQNIQKNLEKAKSDENEEFHQHELDTFTSALEKLRLAKRIHTEFPPLGDKF